MGDLRKEAFDKYNSIWQNLRHYNQMISNLSIIPKESLEAAKQSFYSTQKELTDSFEKCYSIANKLVADKDTFRGQVCILLNELNKVLNDYYYNGSIVEARKLEMECNHIMDILLQDELDEENKHILSEFIAKHKDIYEVIIPDSKPKEKPLNPSPPSGKRCAVIGSAYNRIYGEDLDDERYRDLKNFLYKFLIAFCKKENITTFNIGINYGFSLVFAEVLLLLKENNKLNVDINCIVPYRSISNSWKPQVNLIFNKLLANSTVSYIEDMNGESKSINDLLLDRNNYLISYSDVALISVRGEADAIPYDFFAKAMNSLDTVYNIDTKTLSYKRLKNRG